MSDVKIKFALVWPGALFTACLFTIGKYIIAIYISKSNLGNTYGAASSLIVLLLWIFIPRKLCFLERSLHAHLHCTGGLNWSLNL
jgi:uncharacterized BrkB/YihY/UPF0761 family membrane protein